MLSTTWKIVEESLPGLALALIGYVTFWLRTHVGKSNGHGPLNKQAAEVLDRLDRLEKRMTDVEDDSTGSNSDLD